ncbi:hypothetical protein KIL84_005046 [Mauremys mutica]|uniref:Uncharacterized protein n=1 Tax=Mauremys mutica TaxID=74926 RepID=A0A9D4B5R6_9SAUR|nr:hypothetical protein KIL84_005046 [Mauremys mutica]
MMSKCAAKSRPERKARGFAQQEGAAYGELAIEALHLMETLIPGVSLAREGGKWQITTAEPRLPFCAVDCPVTGSLESAESSDGPRVEHVSQTWRENLTPTNRNWV